MDIKTLMMAMTITDNNKSSPVVTGDVVEFLRGHDVTYADDDNGDNDKAHLSSLAMLWSS